MDAVEGERVGLIAFAGSAVVKSPLTTDLAFARMALDELSPDSVSRGGTAIGDAIRTAVTLLTSGDSSANTARSANNDARVRDIVILTDGEDHETDPMGAAREAGELGIRVICIGLGSDLQGAEIPLSATQPTAPGARPPRAVPTPSTSDAVLEHDGERVRTRMNPDALRQIAEATPGGQFFNVGTGSIELDTVYRRLMREAEQRLYDATPAMTYTEAYQWPLLAGLLLVLVEPLIGTHARRRKWTS
jgi:Ca-activated chloride channel family protein